MASTSVAPTPVKTPAASDNQAVQRKNRPQEGAVDGGTAAAGFASLLQSAAVQEVDVAPLANLMTAQSAANAGEAQGLSEADIAASMLSPDVLAQQAAEVLDPVWSVHSLVGQTAQLDRGADAALRDGSHAQNQRDAGLFSGGAGSLATAALAAAQVPVAAQGVIGTAVAGALVPLANDAGGAAAGAQRLSSDSGAEPLALDASGTADAVPRGERSGEGRLALQGQWTAVDPQNRPGESMQRLLGQMTQFFASQGGVGTGELQRAAGKKESGSTALTGAEAAAVYGGSGTGRLTENAVSQAVASQQAQNGEPQAEPEMTFWMNSRQQRAEMVLEQGGEPVRVQITMQGSEAHVTFLSDAQGTRSMLDASLAQLRDMLAAQGVELAGAQVRTQADGGSNAQSESSGQQDGFMPAGARRMRVQAAEIPGAESGLRLGTGRAGGAGLDVFA